MREEWFGPAVTASLVSGAVLGLTTFFSKRHDARIDAKVVQLQTRLKDYSNMSVHLDYAKNYAERMTLPNEKRSVGEKGQDKHLYGVRQSGLKEALSQMKVSGSADQRRVAEELREFIEAELSPWVASAFRAAEEGSPMSLDDPVLSKLRRLKETICGACNDACNLEELTEKANR